MSQTTASQNTANRTPAGRTTASRGTLLGLFSSDCLKLKRTMALPLAILGPFGVVALTALNYGLRYDYLYKLYEGKHWSALISNTIFLSFLALLLGMSLLASQLAGREHQTHAWKQTLALPVSRLSVYTAKFLLLILLLSFSCLLLFGGTWLLGGLLGFGWEAPLAQLAIKSFYPLPAGLACLALQYGLSVAFRNQAIAMSVGVLGVVIGMYSISLPDFIIWKLPLLENNAGYPEWSVVAGTLLGVVLFTAWSLHFVRKDVN
ncbi:ABC transporter permease [Gorillibacterium sp. CAU 1737]|uniref:ABC transporter permease n=1 Tax=Gorillibacterium sp. CAU 1737 TaxID=3140362 RepID=UPI003260CAAB